YYPSFSNPVGEGNLDNVLYFLKNTQGLIIDVRDNGGGNLTNVETLVSRFITRPTVVGYISHKTGPGHNDFSEPFEIEYKPAAEGRIRWGKPVIVLANRSTFSAANNFVSVMKLLPGVRVVGATTGGGSGMPYSSELPCGWSVRFSACSMLDAERRSTEYGVEPTEGCAVDMNPLEALSGKDTILEFAIALLQKAG
ncbi:MAG: S41 family peptidase, partial [Duncaniella sp.]|nr:S41 family peptidase [Duncaniella sp.]